MTANRHEILAQIRRQLPIGLHVNVTEESDLNELGITSLHLITLIMAVQREYNLQRDLLADSGMPNTVGELVSMVEEGIRSA
jgi:acyl carrier protein